MSQLRTLLALPILTLAAAGITSCGGSTSSGNDGGPDASQPTDASLDTSPTKDATSDVATDGGSDAAVDASDGGLPVVPLVTGTYAVGAAWGPSVGGSPPNYPAGLWGGQTVTFDTAGEMLQISNASWTLSTTSPIAEYGADGVVAWGRWTTGTSTMGGQSTMEAASYIVGVQTASDTSIQASYAVFASSAPTAVGSSTLVGTSNQVTGTVTYNAGTVTIQLANISVGGETFAVSASSGLYATTGFLAGGAVTSSSGCDGGCVANLTNAPMVQGWFIGANGERAALNYGFTSSLGTVSGAVVLK